jgi:hypothetical protein
MLCRLCSPCPWRFTRNGNGIAWRCAWPLICLCKATRTGTELAWWCAVLCRQLRGPMVELLPERLQPRPVGTRARLSFDQAGEAAALMMKIFMGGSPSRALVPTMEKEKAGTGGADRTWSTGMRGVHSCITIEGRKEAWTNLSSALRIGKATGLNGEWRGMAPRVCAWNDRAERAGQFGED